MIFLMNTSYPHVLWVCLNGTDDFPHGYFISSHELWVYLMGNEDSLYTGQTWALKPLRYIKAMVQVNTQIRSEKLKFASTIIFLHLCYRLHSQDK